MDFFRLTSNGWEPDLGLEEYLMGEGVCVIEWADRIEKWLPLDRLEVLLTIHGPRKRGIAFHANGEGHLKYLRVLKQMVSRAKGQG
jgi:tRNA threonylcarbamoyladenosine biosynthesis protein TsaE